MISVLKEYITFFKIMLKDKSLIKFGLGVFLGLSFSMAVILSTIGIMDGFESTLKGSLKQSMGDLNIFSREGFFKLDQIMKEDFQDLKINKYTALIRTEGFLITPKASVGVMIKGVDYNEFESITNINFNLKKDEVALGTVLIEKLGKKIGDEIVLAFATGNKEFSGLPLLRRMKIGQIIDHKIYQKNKRLMYMNRSVLQKLLDLNGLVNIISLNIPRADHRLEVSEEHIERTREMAFNLREKLGYEFAVRPFWSEFSSLIEAVKVEKLIIGLILQLVVIISIFNVLAFVIYLNEKKIKEIFLLGALGMSRKRIYGGQIFLMSCVWVLACFCSMFFLEILDFCLANLNFLKLPGEIYHLGKLSLSLDIFDYLLVFSSTYIWLQIAAYIGLKRLRKGSLLVGLRKEFR